MTMVVSFGIGLGWTIITKGDNWKYLVGFSLAHPGVRGYVWGRIVWAAPYVWNASRVVASDALFLSRAAVGTRTAAAIGSAAQTVALGAASVGAGYTIGAVTGTVIIDQAEKRGMVYEGATKDVLDFYTGSEEAHYWAQGDKATPGYFNIPGNASFIAKHYWNKWT